VFHDIFAYALRCLRVFPGVRFPQVEDRCDRVVAMQQPVLLSPKFGGEVFAYFHAVAVKRHNSIRNWLFGLPGRILCEQSPCQIKWWACSWLCSSPVSPYSVSVSLDFQCTAHAFYPERLSNHCQGLRLTFYEICIKFDAHSQSDLSRNSIMPDTRLQIKGSKKVARPPRSLKFCTLTPNIC
jgi:hypothetical protein